ncbi:SDR family oxidoreductase [Comamonas thiooxydans]|nr:SDR family oxidoreductase [Comamonas thiooxydans]MDH1255970.1 SDR family oxidoreductase [Comamonas thiooxydans]
MPGMIETPHVVGTFSSADPVEIKRVMAQRAARVPLGRQGTPQDVAKLALFLASDDSAFITGQLMVADGGALI